MESGSEVSKSYWFIIERNTLNEYLGSSRCGLSGSKQAAAYNYIMAAVRLLNEKD
jgi:hypothetical protein